MLKHNLHETSIMPKKGNSDYSRQVILHADDLGMNRSITDGIMQGFRQGLLTSALLLANAPDAARALILWKELLRDQAAARLPLHACARPGRSL